MIYDTIVLLKNGVNLPDEGFHRLRILSKSQGQGGQGTRGCLKSSGYESDALKMMLTNVGHTSMMNAVSPVLSLDLRPGRGILRF